ncbi:MAG TPA: hypothetical protein ENG12_02470 [Candidatus Altiarchaeales archaeon]|nr:hypothetical protein [Candidatus Altiarchaeales archaeon]
MRVQPQAAAVKLYELGRLSSGRAAELAGLSRVGFLQILGRYGVSIFDLTTGELKRVLDGLVARHIAELQGLRITGTAGILLKAKQQGHIKATWILA